MKLNRKNRKAFTIVELVIVVGVIGILSAILIPTFANLTSKAQESAKKSDLAAVYASYVADVADGYYGAEEDGYKVATMLAQDKVALSDEDGKYYIYNNNAWETTARASGTSAGNLVGVTVVAYQHKDGTTEEHPDKNAAYSGYTLYTFTNIHA